MLGKLVVYNMEERERVKNVDYTGSKKLERTKIEEQLKKSNTIIRLDTSHWVQHDAPGQVADLLTEFFAPSR